MFQPLCRMQCCTTDFMKQQKNLWSFSSVKTQEHTRTVIFINTTVTHLNLTNKYMMCAWNKSSVPVHGCIIYTKQNRFRVENFSQQKGTNMHKNFVSNVPSVYKCYTAKQCAVVFYNHISNCKQRYSKQFTLVFTPCTNVFIPPYYTQLFCISIYIHITILSKFHNTIITTNI